jgi:hypothetical protein
MFLLDVHVLILNGSALSGIDGIKGFLGELVCIHNKNLLKGKSHFDL